MLRIHAEPRVDRTGRVDRNVARCRSIEVGCDNACIASGDRARRGHIDLAGVRYRLHINAVLRRAGHIGSGHADIATRRCVADIDAFGSPDNGALRIDRCYAAATGLGRNAGGSTLDRRGRALNDVDIASDIVCGGR